MKLFYTFTVAVLLAGAVNAAEADRDFRGVWLEPGKDPAQSEGVRFESAHVPSYEGVPTVYQLVDTMYYGRPGPIAYAANGCVHTMAVDYCVVDGQMHIKANDGQHDDVRLVLRFDLEGKPVN